MPIFNSFQGATGTITLPALGDAVVGIIRYWSIKREESGPSEGAFSLRASLTYVNPYLLNDKSLKKKVLVDIAKKNDGSMKQYRVIYESLTLDDHELRLVKAELVPAED